MDTFDPKPMLTKYHGKPAPSGNLKTERKTGNLLASPFQFKSYGKSGIEVSEIFPKLGECIDDICVIRSMYTDRPNHEPSLFMMNTGDKLPGRPSMGSWLHVWAGHGESESAGIHRAVSGHPDRGTAAVEFHVSAGGVSGHVRSEQRDRAGEADPAYPQPRR